MAFIKTSNIQCYQTSNQMTLIAKIKVILIISKGSCLSYLIIFYNYFQHTFLILNFSFFLNNHTYVTVNNIFPFGTSLGAKYEVFYK